MVFRISKNMEYFIKHKPNISEEWNAILYGDGNREIGYHPSTID